MKDIERLNNLNQYFKSINKIVEYSVFTIFWYFFSSFDANKSILNFYK